MPLATNVELSCFSLILSIFCFSCLGTFWLGAEIICLSGWKVNPFTTGHDVAMGLALFVSVPTPLLLCSSFEGCCFVHFCPFHWALVWIPWKQLSDLLCINSLLFSWAVWGSWWCSRDDRVYFPSSDFLQFNSSLVLVGERVFIPQIHSPWHLCASVTCTKYKSINTVLYFLSLNLLSFKSINIFL